MANNGKNTGNSTVEPGLGDISMIREILMGKHINQYDERFEQMQEEMNFLKEQLDEKIAEIDRFHKLATMDLSKDCNQRFTKLEKQLFKQVDSLENKIQSSSTVDKRDLGKMMANMAKKLMGE